MLISFVNFILQEGLAPINLIIEDNFHRAAPGGTGGVKTIGNYASVTFCMNISESYIFHRLNLATCNFLGDHLLHYRLYNYVSSHHLLRPLLDVFLFSQCSVLL
jgi:branched-chain amino acid aminotransferase